MLNALYERIRNEDDLLVDLMIPDLVVDQHDSNTSVAYALPYERGFTRSALSWADVREWLRTRPQLSRWDVPLRHVDVRLQVDAEEHKVPLPALLTAELRVDDEVFVLSDGDVLRIDKSYLEQVDTYVERIPWTDFPFPPYEGGTEGRYLDQAITSWPRRLAKLDLRDTRLPGETPFETCDLFSDDMRLIFAKLKGRTNRFSHLCTQAETAAAVFKRSEPAREQLKAKVDDATNEPAIRESVRRVTKALAAGRQREVTITLLLLGSWRRQTLRSLPLASKQRLHGLARRLEELGYRLEVAAPTACDQSVAASRETSRSTSTP